MCQQTIPQFWLKPGAFWGITFPLSAIAKSCSRVTGYKLNAGHFTTIHSFFQFFKTTMPPTKSTLLSVLGSRYQDLSRTFFAKWLHPTLRSDPCDKFLSCCQNIPLISKIHTKLIARQVLRVQDYK